MWLALIVTMGALLRSLPFLMTVLAGPGHRAWAVPPGVTSAESFSSSAQVLAVQPKKLTVSDSQWENFKRAQLEFMAEVIEMYGDREIYLLDRDQRFNYAFAVMMSRQEPSLAHRIHLINVSRDTENDKNLNQYLIQEGLLQTDELESPLKVVLVDTGWSGSVAEKIINRCWRNIKASIHLISSRLDKYNTSKVFHVASKLVDPVHDYENLPKFSNKSAAYQEIEGRWTPVSLSPIDESQRQTAFEYLQDLAYFSNLPSTAESFHSRRQTWRELFELWSPIQNGKMEMKAAVERMLVIRENLKSRLIYSSDAEKAIVTDFLNIIHTGARPVSSSVHELSRRVLSPKAVGAPAYSKYTPPTNASLEWAAAAQKYPEIMMKIGYYLESGLREQLLLGEVETTLGILQSLSNQTSPSEILKAFNQSDLSPYLQQSIEKYLKEYSNRLDSTSVAGSGQDDFCNREYSPKATSKTAILPVK